MKGNYIVEINRNCNSNCRFCAYSEHRGADPSIDELKKGIRENRHNYESIILTGGEPTIRKDLIAIIRYIKSLNYRDIAISTNGLMLYYTGFVDKLVSEGLTQFIVSFQTVVPEDYAKITGVRRAHDLVIRGISNVNNTDARLAINTVIHKMNYKMLPLIVEYLANLKVYNIQLSYMNPIGRSVVNGRSDMAVRITDVLPFIDKSVEVAASVGFQSLAIENIPICMMEKHIAKIADLRKANKDYYNACKIKIDRCRKCRYYKDCDGIWEAYIKQFGDSEIDPK